MIKDKNGIRRSSPFVGRSIAFFNLQQVLTRRSSNNLTASGGISNGVDSLLVGKPGGLQPRRCGAMDTSAVGRLIRPRTTNSYAGISKRVPWNIRGSK